MTSRPEGGFSLVETLVATTLVLLVVGAVFQVVMPSQRMFRVQPEVSDVQQRLRVGVDVLTHDLMMAGAGAYAGSQGGPLIGVFAPILPSRQAGMASYHDGGDVFRPDAITLLYVPSTPSQTTLAQPMSSMAAGLMVDERPGCPLGQTLCGFVVGTHGVVYDETGAYDVFAIDQIEGQIAYLRPNQGGDLSRTYPAGAAVVEVRHRVYFHGASTNQLLYTDGLQPAVPVLDNVVALQFEYFGDPRPPALVGPDRRVTYGPRPPPLDVMWNGWPAGENCTFQVADGQYIARLADLDATSADLVRLQASALVDGPWCPDGLSLNRFDADLLRIRRVRVTLRVQAGDPWRRSAPAGEGLPRVPDQQVQFDVSPRNMNLGR